MRSSAGFTLVEVLVALGIVALTLPALLLVLQGFTESTSHTRDKTIASWVAADRLERLRLDASDGVDPRQAETSGKADMAGREWEWRLEQEDTAVEGFRRVDVSVAPSPYTAPLITLTTFMRVSTNAESPKS